MKRDKDILRNEYPENLIKSGVRGKYAKSYREGTKRVIIPFFYFFSTFSSIASEIR